MAKCPKGHCYTCLICFRELRGKKLHSGECNFECGHKEEDTKMITMEHIQEVVTELTRKKENTEKYIDKNISPLSSATISMLLSDIDLFKRYAEIANDIDEEDLKDQTKIEEFLACKDSAVSGTLYNEKIKPVEEMLV